MFTWIALLSACTPPDTGSKAEDTDTGVTDSGDTDSGVTDTAPADADGDGYSAATGDCDDADPAVNPGADERPYNGLDDDCDPATPDDDVDGDGAPYATDCDDDDPTRAPGLAEVCDEADNDCDGEIDEGVGTLFYPDLDYDGFGDASGEATFACTQPVGTAAVGGDCDDTDGTVSPDGIEVCNERDDDCDGEADEGVKPTAYFDGDGDGYGSTTTMSAGCTLPEGAVTNADDCDDTDAGTHPGAPERCDAVDQDCDGVANNDAIDASTWYTDTDSDSFGDPAAAVVACDQPAGTVVDASDCDDSAASVFPGAPELCDAVDQDCDGDINDGDGGTFYADTDGDGHGDAASPVIACTAPAGHVALDDDCDDTRADVSPEAPELCDGLDNDCDGNFDEGAGDAFIAWPDDDGDGYGDSAAPTEVCARGDRFVDNDEDCDDADASTNPDTLWYADTDGDGYGDVGVTTVACDPGTAWSRNAEDCDDTDGSLNPDTFWYWDADLDGYGNIDLNTNSCTTPDGYVRAGTDCDDADDTVHPGAAESCDSLDTDCDGSLNDPDSVDALTFYADTDADTYGDPDTTITGCYAELGWVTDDTDCAPDNVDAFPGSEAFEYPDDGIDQDCDGEDVCRDLNCDGHPDLVQVNWYDGSDYTLDSMIYYGDGSGITTSGATTLSTTGMVGAQSEDINQDGYPDLLFLGYYDGSYGIASTIFWGSAAGYSHTDSTNLTGWGASDSCVDDLDNDGYIDIVLLSYRSSDSTDTTTTYIYWGSDAGWSVSDRSELSHERSVHMACEDLDDDGYIDLVTPTWYDGDYTTTSYVWWGSSAGYSDSDRTSLPTYGSYRAYIEDFNLDGHKDLLFPNYTDGDNSVSSYVYWGSSAGYSTASVTELPGYRTMSAATRDLNHDGWPDIALGSYYDGDYTTVSYVYWGGSGGFSTTSRSSLTSTYGVYDLTADDLDQDGFEDLIFANFRSGTSSYYAYSQVWWGAHSGYDPANVSALATSGTIAVSTADVNEDGYPDVLWPGYYDGASYGGSTYIYYADDTGLSAARKDTVPSFGASRRAIVVGD